MSRSFCLLLVLLCGVAEAKSPRVVRGPVRTGGTLSRYQIRSTIQRHLSRVKLCYSRALLGAQPSLHGRVVVQFVIEPSGRVSTATARDYMRPKGAGTSMVSCITREVRKWRFPKPLGGGKVVVNYPFIFSQG